MARIVHRDRVATISVFPQWPKKNFVAYSTKSPRKELMFLYIETQKKELSDSLVKIGQDHIFTKFQNKPAEGKRKKRENGYISSNKNDNFV